MSDIKGANAINLFPTEPRFKDGGDDGDSNELVEMSIQKADNGWVIVSTFESGDSTVEVFSTDHKDGNKKALDSILSNMGLKGLFNIK